MLMMPLVRFVAATDPRWLSTLEAIQKSLVRDGMVYRYKRDDGLPGKEGAFSACSFWYVEALASIGRHDDARELFESLLARRNPLGLLSEDLAFEDGEAWGNFPQTYSHVGLISAAMRLSRPWSEAG